MGWLVELSSRRCPQRLPDAVARAVGGDRRAAFFFFFFLSRCRPLLLVHGGAASDNGLRPHVLGGWRGPPDLVRTLVETLCHSATRSCRVVAR